MANEVSLTNAEWSLMECLWEVSPRTAMQTVDFLKKSVGWAKSTTLTMLKRMTVKGLISCDESGSARLYSPLIQRDDAVEQETEDFINRVYRGSVGLMINAVAQKQKLSEKEIEELYQILKKAEARK